MDFPAFGFAMLLAVLIAGGGALCVG